MPPKLGIGQQMRLSPSTLWAEVQTENRYEGGSRREYSYRKIKVVR